MGEVLMGIRDRLASVVRGSSDESVRDAVNDALSERNWVRPSELETLRKKVDTLSNSPETTPVEPGSSSEQLTSMQQEIKMLLGAIDVMNKQLQEIRSTADQALAAARQAGQHGTTARATAEATSDGLNALEDRFAALIERLGAAGLDWNRTATGGRATCTYSGCDAKHHARGLCKKHYRLWRRSQLEDWVGPEGLVPFSSDGSIYKVDKRYAGRQATIADGVITISDKRVPAKRIDV